tara:strand:+ start:19939 stop:20205 length:267 start_codon:yes stop_codon:yes gene_type:complete
MTEVEETDPRPAITLDGEKYIIEELSEKGQYYTTQIQILNKDVNDAQYGLERLNVSRAGFINMLRVEIAQEAEETPEAEEANDTEEHF